MCKWKWNYNFKGCCVFLIGLPVFCTLLLLLGVLMWKRG